MSSSSETVGSFTDAVSLLKQLAGESFSGSFRAEREGVVKVLYMADGRLACASSTDPRDRLGRLLEREGRITSEQLETAQDKALPGEALGSVLVNLGTIEPGDLLWGAQRQVEGVLGSVLTWKDGSFRTRTGPLPERAVNLKLALGPVLVAAARRLGDATPALEVLGPLDRTYRVRPVPFRDELEPEVAEILDLLDGSRDLASVCSASDMEEDEATGVLVALKVLDLLEEGVAAVAPIEDRSDDQQARAHDDDLEQEEIPTPGSPETEPVLATEQPDSGEEEPQESLPEEAEEPDSHALPFDGEDELDRHLDEEDDEDVLGDRGWVPPEESGQRPLLRRGWILGAALPLLALVLIFMFSGGDDPPTLDATGAPPAGDGGASPDATAAEARQEVPDQEGVATADPAASVAHPTPPAQPSSQGPAGTSTPSPATAKASPPPVAIPRLDSKLEERSGYQAGLEAYKAGDFSGAAKLWRPQWADARQGSFTLQVLMACEPGTLQRMRDLAPTSERLFLAPVQVKGRSCYKVLWGTYPDRAQAEAAIPTVPAFFTSGGDRPWPAPVSTLQPR